MQFETEVKKNGAVFLPWTDKKLWIGKRVKVTVEEIAPAATPVPAPQSAKVN